MRVTYIGHATLLLELDGIRILTDPNFEPKLGRLLPRVSAPGIALADLPKLDALLLTHAHADHLSFDSLERLPRDIPLIAPPAVAKWLRRLGFDSALALGPGESMSTFFAGDTALVDDTHHLVEHTLWNRGRELDLALLPIGYAPWWKPGFRKGHLTHEDALELFERLRASVLVPYHWGTFRHVTATAHDAINRLKARLASHHLSDAVKILEPGETLDLSAS